MGARVVAFMEWSYPFVKILNVVAFVLGIGFCLYLQSLLVLDDLRGVCFSRFAVTNQCKATAVQWQQVEVIERVYTERRK